MISNQGMARGFRLVADLYASGSPMAADILVGALRRVDSLREIARVVNQLEVAVVGGDGALHQSNRAYSSATETPAVVPCRCGYTTTTRRALDEHMTDVLAAEPTDAR